MSYNDFLENLDKKHQKQKELLEQQNEKQKIKKEEDKEFLTNFNKYYATDVSAHFKRASVELESRFEVKYDRRSITQQNNINEGCIYLIPKFDTHIKRIKIGVIGEAERKLISITSNAKDHKGYNYYTGEGLFQGNMEEFKKLNIEDKIIELLEYLFNK